MMDLLVAISFVVMLLTPCVVALGNGVVTGADLGVKDATEAEHSFDQV